MNDFEPSQSGNFAFNLIINLHNSVFSRTFAVLKYPSQHLKAKRTCCGCIDLT